MQVVPILLHLVKAISSVRLYIPKDLRSLDSRQSVGKSIKVSTYMYDQIEIFRNQVVTVFLRYHTFALVPIREPGKFLRVIRNAGNYFLWNPDSKFRWQGIRNLLPGIPNPQHGIRNLITLPGAIIYLFICSMLTGSKASLSRWLALARSNRRHGNQRWWIENCYTGLYLVYSIWAWLTATVVIDCRSIDKLCVCVCGGWRGFAMFCNNSDRLSLKCRRAVGHW